MDPYEYSRGPEDAVVGQAAKIRVASRRDRGRGNAPEDLRTVRYGYSMKSGLPTRARKEIIQRKLESCIQLSVDLDGPNAPTGNQALNQRSPSSQKVVTDEGGFLLHTDYWGLSERASFKAAERQATGASPDEFLLPQRAQPRIILIRVRLGARSIGSAA